MMAADDSSASSSPYDAAIATCQQQIDQLKAQIAEIRAKSEGNGKMLSTVGASRNLRGMACHFQVRRVLKGHFQKIVSLYASTTDPHFLVSAGQDGKLILWNTLTCIKSAVISLRSVYIMACALSPRSHLVCAGGLDNIVSIFKLPLPPGSNKTDYTEAPNIVLEGHQGYISGIRFLNNDNECITCSGDKSMMIWDVNTREMKSVYTGHKGDMLSLSVTADTANPLVCSGSTDRSCRIWDLRMKPMESNIMTFASEHDADVNNVEWMPGSSGTIVGTAGDDGFVRVFDLRASAMIEKLQATGGEKPSSVTSIAFSKSGSLVFGASEDGAVNAWDIRVGQLTQTLRNHDSTVAALTVNSDGRALITASWDMTAKVWTQ